MRPQKVADQDILAGLMTVLRTKGYDGASLSELAAATGLKKASLYHRFPGGKQEMATAVLAYVGEWVEEHIYQVLIDRSKTLEERIEHVIQQIAALYDDGKATCILRALSMDTGLHLFGKYIQSSMEKWIDGFTQLGKDVGMSQVQAYQQALQTLINLQGSLVVAKGLEQPELFLATLANIKSKYMVHK